MPEIIIVSDAVEGTPVDLDGESRHEHVEAKLSRRGRVMLNEDEEIRKFEKKSNSGGIRRNIGLCERGKEYGEGRGRKDFRTERGERSAKVHVSL